MITRPTFWPPKKGSEVQAGALYRQVRDAFRAAGLDTPDLDAKHLVSASLCISISDLILRSDKDVPEDQKDLVLERMAKRLDHCPVGRILGEREFYGRAFQLNSATLEPRPDTEVIVDAVLSRMDTGRELIVADIGTGTGAIAVTLLCESPDVIVVATDLSPDALACAYCNAVRHGVSSRLLLIRADFCAPLTPGFNWVVSNPPYIPSEEIGRLSPGVKNHDPLLALDGGADGLDAYRRIGSQARSILMPGGGLVLEHGYDQSADVQKMLQLQSYMGVEVVGDLAGHARGVVALVD